jgi:hypothetical protein
MRNSGNEQAAQVAAYERAIRDRLEPALIDYSESFQRLEELGRDVWERGLETDLNAAKDAHQRLFNEVGAPAMTRLSRALELVVGRAEELPPGVSAERNLRWPVGPYGVVLESGDADGSLEFDGIAAVAICSLGWDPADAIRLWFKLEELGPQQVLSGVDFDAALQVKSAFVRLKLPVKITEGRRPAVTERPRREAIPEVVRHEVWRRDGGRCVECGSRERH